MTGPIVAQAGIVRIELRPLAGTSWQIWSAGEPIGAAYRDGFVYAAVAGDVSARAVTVEKAAVMLADRLNTAYFTWCQAQPVTVRRLA